MKITYFSLFIILINSVLNAQTISFSDPIFKAKLLQSSINSTVAKNIFDDYFAIDANTNGEIEIAEALQVAHLDVSDSSIQSLNGIENFTNLISLQCSNNQISNLNLSNLIQLTDLNCSNNSITTLNLSASVLLENVNCQSNNLTSLDASDLLNLVSLECSDNKLTTLKLSNLGTLLSLSCNNNELSTLEIQDLTSLETLECSRNKLTTLDLSLLTNITQLTCTNNLLQSLNGTTLTDLINLNCANNQLSSLMVEGLTNLSALNCNNNLLAELNISTLASLRFLYANNNKIQSTQVAGLSKIRVLDLSNNQISTIDVNGLSNLQYLYLSNNKLVTLDLISQIELQFLLVSNNLLNSLYIKNGSNEGVLSISGNPDLTYICADESELAFIEEEINTNGYTNCFVNSYCTFVPSGNYYTIEFKNKLDNNKNGCDALDGSIQELKYAISDGTSTTSYVPNFQSISTYGVKEGSFTVSPLLENPNYFTISPSNATVSFPDSQSPFSTSFCLIPKGDYTDLEVSLLPLSNARSNFESTYKIVFKNKGTVIQNGTVNLIFDDSAMNLVSANPDISSQNNANLSWNFTNLAPQETRTILVFFGIKSSLSNGYELNFKSSISNIADETPNDNSADLRQMITTHSSLNDKICLEGNTVSYLKLGDYLHYMIRFENSGVTTIQNMVIKDIIDTNKFNLETLVPISGSHPFVTKINTNGTVEFILENSNLNFDPKTNSGYIAFKIKSLTSLMAGDQITNSATLYFDNQKPLDTNLVTTNFQSLNVPIPVFSDVFTIYPNPVKTNFQIENKNATIVHSIAIYNMLGQLVQSFVATENTTTFDVSQLKKGVYIVKINSTYSTISSKFVKE